MDLGQTNVNDVIYIKTLEYLSACFGQRDFDKIMSMLSEDFSAIGTGLDEYSFTREEFACLIKREFAQVPSDAEYKLNHIKIGYLLPTVALSVFNLDVSMAIFDQCVKLNHARASIVFVQSQGTWLMQHLHMSLPFDLQQAGEAIPILELENRNKLLNTLVDEKTRQLTHALQEINVLAKTDKLTNVFNRSQFEEDMGRELYRASRYNTQFALIMLDIDHFKQINDQLGHLAGDQVLVQIVNILNKNVRMTDIVYRWGGEEFIILCPDTKWEDASRIAEKLRALIAQTQIMNSSFVTSSFGVTSYRAQDSLQSILSRADAALYRAKHSGRNKVEAEAP